MTKKLGVALVAVFALGCGKSDKKSEGGGGGTSGKGGCETKATKPAELVTGKAPQIIAPLAGLKLGMSPAEAAKVCPNFFGDDDGKKKGTFSVGEIVGKFGETYAQARLNFVADKLATVELSLPAEIEGGLTAAWGAPKVSSGSAPAHAWLDEASGMRGILGPAESDGRRELAISTFTPLAAFIEKDTAKIAWKPDAVLGKLPADLAKTFPQYLKAKTSEAVSAKTKELMADMEKEVAAMGVDTKRGDGDPEFELPASPLGDGLTHVILYTDDDKSVRSYGIWFHTASTFPAFGWPTQSADLIKLLDTQYGPSKKVKETLGERTQWYDAEKGIRAGTRLEKPEDLDLVFVRYMPLAKFFGAPGPLWGFEKAERPLIGATPDEIMAAYKEYELKRDDANGTITMSMPPTDYDGDTSHTTVLMFIRGGKIGQWNTHIPFEDYDPARAEYEAALNTKFGAPKKAPHDHLLFSKKVDVQYSKYTNELDIEVSK